MITATYWWRVQHLLNHNLFTILDVNTRTWGNALLQSYTIQGVDWM